MQASDFFSEEDLRLFSSPSQNHQHQRYEWNLDAPSDTSLDDEVHLSAALKAEDQRNKRPHRPQQHASSMPLPISSPDPMPSHMSVSPAAMFLASFSPVVKPAPLPDDEGQSIAGYTLGSVIGHGGTSIIRRAFSESGGVVAVKVVRCSELNKQGNPTLARKKLEREAEVWSSLSHEHILPLFTAVHTSYADFFVTIYCPAGSMYDILKRDGTPALPQDDAGMMFRQVVRGLRYLHEVAMYVHRDIKLENVLVDEMGVCKIGDFGMARKIGEIDDDDLLESESDDPFSPGNVAIHRAATLALPSSRRQGRSSLQPAAMIARHNTARHRSSTSSTLQSTTYHAVQPGSLPYAAPEILLPQTNGPLRPHPAQDIWALGVLLYALLTGRFPFSDVFEPRLHMKILHGTFDLPSDIGKGAERVLLGCLERNSGQRWSISMVDEVAWGIGWGSEGDDVTPAESDEEFETHCRNPTRPHSRSHSRPPALSGSVTTPLNQSHQEEAVSPYADDGSTKARLALEAASRRSVSRARRSQSRAPIPTHVHHLGSNFSRGVSRSGHPSRAPSPSPSSILSPLTSSIESLFLGSPTSSYDDRGRRPRRKAQFAASRSPSPSVVPRTPADFGAPFGVFRNILPVVDDQPDEFKLDGDSMSMNMGIHARLDEDDDEQVKRGRSKSTRERVPVHARTHGSLTFLGKGVDPDDDSVDNIGLRRWNEDLERSTSSNDGGESYLFRSNPDKERSRSCGYGYGLGLKSPISRSPSSSGIPLYHATIFESEHERKLKGRRRRSIPPISVSPSSPRLSSVAGTPRATDLPSATSVLKELLKSSQGEGSVDDSSADMAAVKSAAGRSRSADYGFLGWS